MGSPQVPKYQAIFTVLRQQILDGTFPAGSKLPPQQDLADSFGVTLMTLRQAMSGLESEGLVWAARGKGTFVADRPVDISLGGNLSSFVQQMQAAGLDMTSELLATSPVRAGAHEAASAALGSEGDLLCLTRRRLVSGDPISLQRSYLSADLGVVDAEGSFPGDSLYGAIEDMTGWVVAEALESITAVSLAARDAKILETKRSHPALLSIRTSVNQFGRPFLYDEALLVGGRCTITANRTSERLSLTYGLD